MNADQLESLLRQAAMEGPRVPPSADCLDIRTILTLLDDPAQVRQADLEHLTSCRHCQRAVVLVRRDREIIEAPLPDEVGEAGKGSTKHATTMVQNHGVDRPRAIKLSRWMARPAALMGMAAVLILAVGLGWWLTREPALLGPVTGQFELASVTRGGEEVQRKYAITVQLNADAHLTFLYLDHARKLKLPSDATERAEGVSAGARRFGVTVTHDPPGPQWIAAVASEGSFNPLALRDELQAAIDGLPTEARFEEVTARLEESLRERRDVSFRGHSFEVPVAGGP